MMDTLVNDITIYYSAEENEKPLITVIKGEIGSGKTAFVRNLIDELHQVTDFGPYLQ